ncbi:MAG TPA: hypothetical protein PK419_10730 [Spirochaetota bacterium]|jgi:hypothetical protein|nr:hypothetical protein [Spirochaetota bacterium]HPJ16060.1 hypothetical protein [Spirochaetota bacterium]HPY03981.1 hypothetical protein [Spirochaetota bacterium]HQA53319.1 hypothetical protein [Spirochaetota bacterium]
MANLVSLFSVLHDNEKRFFIALRVRLLGGNTVLKTAEKETLLFGRKIK